MTDAYLLGQNIAEAAQRKGISNAGLAHALDCSEEFIEKLIKGRAYLSWDKLTVLSKTVGMPICSLLNLKPISEGERFILDIINHYIDLCDAISVKETAK